MNEDKELDQVQDLPIQMMAMAMKMVTSQVIKMAFIVIMALDEERMMGGMVKVIPKAIMMLCKRIVIISAMMTMKKRDGKQITVFLL